MHLQCFCLYCEDTQKKLFPDFLLIVFGNIFTQNNGKILNLCSRF